MQRTGAAVSFLKANTVFNVHDIPWKRAVEKAWNCLWSDQRKSLEVSGKMLYIGGGMYMIYFGEVVKRL